MDVFDWELPVDALDWDLPDFDGLEWELPGLEVCIMPVMDAEKSTTVLPGGVAIDCPEAVSWLRRSLAALDSGMGVRAWWCAVRAVDVLDELTGGQGAELQDENVPNCTSEAV